MQTEYNGDEARGEVDDAELAVHHTILDCNFVISVSLFTDLNPQSI